jgi:hypothetical protein
MWRTDVPIPHFKQPRVYTFELDGWFLSTIDIQHGISWLTWLFYLFRILLHATVDNKNEATLLYGSLGTFHVYVQVTLKCPLPLRKAKLWPQDTQSIDWHRTEAHADWHILTAISKTMIWTSRDGDQTETSQEAELCISKIHIHQFPWICRFVEIWVWR